MKTFGIDVSAWQKGFDFAKAKAEEVTSMLIKQQINTLEVDDQTALRMLEFYPEWVSDMEYTVGYKVQYNWKQ